MTLHLGATGCYLLYGSQSVTNHLRKMNTPQAYKPVLHLPTTEG